MLVAAAFVLGRRSRQRAGSAGVGSVVLGLALQDTVSDLFVGISLISDRHFKEGDLIVSDGVAGGILQMD